MPLLLAADVENDAALVHHDQPVAVLDRVCHVVGDHQRGQLVLVDDFIGQIEHLGRRGRVQRGGVLVKQQQLWLSQRGHHQRQRLALSAGEQTDLCGHAILQTEIQGLEQLVIGGRLVLGDAPAKSALLAAAHGQGHVLDQLHVGGGAHHRVLEYAADQKGALVLGQSCQIVAVEHDAALIHAPHTGDRV